MSSYAFGAIEAVFIIGLVIAFYIWQMRTLKRDVKARENREAKLETTARSVSPPPAAGHSEGKHELDET